MGAPTYLGRLRAVRDCGVLRAAMGDPNLCALVRDGLVSRHYINGRVSHLCDYRLTRAGKLSSSSEFWRQ